MEENLEGNKIANPKSSQQGTKVDQKNILLKTVLEFVIKLDYLTNFNLQKEFLLKDVLDNGLKIFYREEQSKKYFLHYKPCPMTSLSSRKSWDIYAFSNEKIDFYLFCA